VTESEREAKRAEMARLRDEAEKTYNLLYEAHSDEQAHWRYAVASDALFKARRLAEELGLEGEAVEISLRREHIRNVYEHQFQHSRRTSDSAVGDFREAPPEMPRALTRDEWSQLRPGDLIGSLKNGRTYRVLERRENGETLIQCIRDGRTVEDPLLIRDDSSVPPEQHFYRSKVQEPAQHRSWRPFQNGETIGTKGSEDGAIVLDEEHIAGARISLERKTEGIPFAITCGVYGWFFHTKYCSSEDEAMQAFQEMKSGLDGIIDVLGENFENPADLDTAVIKAINDFVDKFPT